MDNAFQVVIRLPKSDGFHTRTDRDLAGIARRAVAHALTADPALSGYALTVSVERVPVTYDAVDACTEDHRRAACMPWHTDDCPYV